MIEKMPQHIGFIVDGNRRWARARGLPTFEGHRRGFEKLKQIGEWCLNRGIGIMTVYAFSVENWKRSVAEVAHLMDLVYFVCTHEVDSFMKQNVRVRIIGRREGLQERIHQAINEIEQRTACNNRGLFQIAINYGGHAEITDAVRAIVREGIAPEAIDDETIANHLYAPDVPPPDLIIRTSGEQRLSGFLTWQSAYSELYFCPVFWPDFSQDDFEVALQWYANRDRRYGK